MIALLFTTYLILFGYCEATKCDPTTYCGFLACLRVYPELVDYWCLRVFGS